jgi:thioredoxin reductase (NADPH)
MTTTEPARRPETPDVNGAFPRLSEPQLQTLAPTAGGTPCGPGTSCTGRGDEGGDFFVVLEGKVAMLEGLGDAGRVVAVQGPGRFLGELGLPIGQAAFLTAMAVEPGEVLAVPPTASRQDRGDLVRRLAW